MALYLVAKFGNTMGMKECPHVKRQEQSGFFERFSQLISSERLEEITDYKKTRRGCPPKAMAKDLIVGLVFHLMSGAGKFGEHFRALTGQEVGDSSLAERRGALPWEVFERIMDWALRPMAREEKHPGAFYRGWRLVGLDGTRFSLSNTPPICWECAKAVTRRMKAAFAKMDLVVLLELGLHNPIAAAINRKTRKQGAEWELAMGLLPKLPSDSLLLADRLYGCKSFLWELKKHTDSLGTQFLVRARSQIKPKVLERYSDGSALIEVTVRDANRRIVGRIRLREIRARVKRKGRPAAELRLWTSLLDPEAYPAEELIRLYEERWEHEVYYREMKIEMRGGNLLSSHTPETAAQEIAALVMATALISRERAEIADGHDIPPLRISFIKTLRFLEPLWLTFELGQDILSEEQKQQLIEKFYDELATMATQKRRPRSCPRKVRQPVSSWPRKLINQSYQGEVEVKILKPAP